jgi:hypothetical protein
MVSEHFETEYLKMCNEDIKEACLLALSTLSMRHIDNSSRNHFEIIHKVLNNNEFKLKEINKLKSIIENVLRYDSILLDNIRKADKKIGSMLRGKEDNQPQQILEIEKQRNDIKKWWE